MFAAEHEAEGLEQLQKQFHSFQQQMQEENQKLTEQLSQQIDAMQQQWLAEEQKLKQEINNHKDEINTQNQRIEELQVENNNFQHKTENLFGKFTHGNQNLRHLLDKTTSQRKHNSTVIAFSAYATAEQDYDVGGIVQFDSIITNEGGLYSGQSSTFTCLVPGYYQFSVNVRATPGHSMQGQIEIAGEVVAAVWADHDYDSASNTVIACCPRNNQVTIFNNNFLNINLFNNISKCRVCSMITWKYKICSLD